LKYLKNSHVDIFAVFESFFWYYLILAVEIEAVAYETIEPDSNQMVFKGISLNRSRLMNRMVGKMEKIKDWLRLQLTPGWGRVQIRKACQYFSDASAIFAAPYSEVEGLFGVQLAQSLRHKPPNFDQIKETVSIWIAEQKEGIPRAIYGWNDEEYPKSLLDAPDPPVLLYCTGQVPVRWPCTVGIVGSRNPTAQGLENAFQFARQISQCGYSIVSGMALGIDAAAHQGALSSGQPCLPTVAVIGSGPDVAYPARHSKLMQEISKPGLVLSEYPPGTPPAPYHFPARNRIIASLSQAILVVEAGARSGSLITASIALELGREVMAIPGSIHSVQSKGCHVLIQQGAKLIDSVDAILQDLPKPGVSGLVLKNKLSTQVKSNPEAQQLKILEAIGHEPSNSDQIQARLKCSVEWLQSELFKMELEGLIVSAPGGQWQRRHYY